MKILISEDNADDRLLLSGALKKLGHDVLVTEHGKEAWDVYQKQHMSLLISDWIMPFLDGLELCRRIRAENYTRYTYIILITAFGGKRNYLEGIEAGVDDFLVKPFDPDELAARLRVADRILKLQREIKQLEGLLPICSYCKRIRSGKDQWFPLEDYVARHTSASFTHGICPDCVDQFKAS